MEEARKTDAQRAYDYAQSTEIEVTPLTPKAPYMLSRAMIWSGPLADAPTPTEAAIHRAMRL